MSNRDFLLEIGTEEIPARFLPDTLQQLKNLAAKLFAENRLFYEEIYTYATPRRLVLLVKDLEEQQRPKEEKKKGPSRKAAFDEQGNPTKAALGFANKMGFNVEDLSLETIDKGEYLVALERVEGRGAVEVLPELAPSLIKSLSFPKSMYWDETLIRFARPIRWLLCLYGGVTISFSLGNLAAGNTTRGHRLHDSGSITVNNVQEYFTSLEEAGVELDQERRASLIEEELYRAASGENMFPRVDPGLLEEVTYLVEHPSGVLCSFSADYLNLPEEVLVTTLQGHQRYFPVENERAEIAPYFVTISNNKSAPVSNIRHGNEKVIRARLADARFFYEEDLRIPLKDYVPRLKNILFQEDLGSLYDKTERLQSLTEYILEKVQLLDETEKQGALRASYLAKADLATQMVDEFPELQGSIGREYALKSGESKAAAEALYEHYLPRFAGDELPETRAGAVVALSDKIDHVAGCFAVGLRPSGSQDPYGLRRQSLGILQVLLEHNFALTIRELTAKTLVLLAEKLKELPRGEVEKDVVEFFHQRVRFFMQDKGMEYDIVEAVLNTPTFDNIPFTWQRIKFLQSQQHGEVLQKASTAYIRVANLAQNADEEKELAEGLLLEPEEKELHKNMVEAEEKISREIKENSLPEVLHSLAELKTPIDGFFDKVMVMAEDEQLRMNRLVLLKKLRDLYLQLADFSKIVFPGNN